MAIENAIKNKLVVRSPFPLYVIELDECASGSASGRIIGEIVRYTRGAGRRARKRKAEIEVNRTNGELLGSRFHSTSTRLRNPLPSPYHPSITTAIRIRDCRDDRIDGDGNGNPQEADSKKVEDVSPSIKLPRTRERRPPGYVASKTSLSSTSTFLFFSFFLCSSPAAFLLSPRSCCYRKKAAMSSKGAIDFDRLPHPPSKRLRPYGGIRERRNNKTHVLQRKTVNSIADISSLREAGGDRRLFNIFCIISLAKCHITRVLGPCRCEWTTLKMRKLMNSRREVVRVESEAHQKSTADDDTSWQI